jgi:hypothetical protein
MQELYKAREYAAYEKQNLPNTGIAKGRAEEQLKIAKSLMDILPLEVIAEKTGLSVETLKQLKN